jgi:hypothetical protein
MPPRPKYTVLDDSLYEKVLGDERVESVMLAVADGLTVARKVG